MGKEVAEDFPQKNCKFKSRNEWRNGRRTKQMVEHRKKRKNKDSVDEPLDLNDVKLDKTIVLKDARVMVYDDAEHPPFQKFFYVFENKIEADEPCGALDPNRNQAGKSGFAEVPIKQCRATNEPLEFPVYDTPPPSQESFVPQVNGFDIEAGNLSRSY